MMNSIDFENDTSIICKAYSLKLNRNIKNITLMLLYHISYEVIEIKIYEISSNKLIGREIYSYSDIYDIFDNYFLCFNEDMSNIYSFLNNCFLLKKYQANINENSKQINIELLILKERELNMKTLNITTFQDQDGYKKVLDKINELNSNMNKSKAKIYKVAPIHYIIYENDIYLLCFEIFLEKEIEVIGIKARVFNKDQINIINDSNNEKEGFYAAYFSFDEINIISNNYYQSIANLEEISKEIAINFHNKNIKIEGISNEKLKLKMKVISSAMNISDIDLILNKDANIKDKYIEIINSLKLKNEYLIKREIYQGNKQSKINKNINSINLFDNVLSSSYNSLNNLNSSNNSSLSSEKKLLGKKKNRGKATVNKASIRGNKNKKEKKEIKADNNIIIEEPEKENENLNINNYNELYQRLIKQERERLANISKKFNEVE